MDVFWTKIFKKATGRTVEKPLRQNQKNLQTTNNTAAVYNIILYIKRTGGILDKTPPPFYLFGSEVKYIQVL